MDDTWIILFSVFALFINVWIFFVILKGRIEQLEIDMAQIDHFTYENKLCTEKIFYEVYSLTNKYIRGDKDD